MDGAPGGLQSMGLQRVGHDWAWMQAHKGRNQALFDYSQSFLQHLALGYFQQVFNFSLCYHKTAVNLKLTFIFSISFSFSPGSTVTFFLLWSLSAMLRALGQDIMRYLHISMEEFCLLSFASVMDWHCGSVCSVTFKRTHFRVGGEAVYWPSFNYITYSALSLFVQSITLLLVWPEPQIPHWKLNGRDDHSWVKHCIEKPVV